MTLDPNPVPTGCSRSEVVAALRRALPRLEGFSAKALPLGVPAIDRYLPQGGLAFGAVHEIGPESASDTGAAFGFVLSLLARMPREGPVLLVVSPRGLARCGRPYGRGLNALGLDPARVLLVEAANERDALWAIEEALRSGAPTAVAGAIGKSLDLRASQKLQLAARSTGVPLILLRPGGATESTAAATRWRIGAAGAARDRFGLVTGWRWRLWLERCRNGRPGNWLVEWDHAAHRFRLVAGLADPALPHARGAERGEAA